VQQDAKPLELEFWRRRDVDVQQLALDQYVTTIAGSLGLRDPAA